MIKLFRKIRLNLLSENRFSKYLIYAFGEIILVVIGILIALGINNWNTANKERENYKKQLIKIVQNIKSDSIQLEELKQSRLSAKEIASSLMKELNDKNIKNHYAFTNSFLVLTGEKKFVSNIDKMSTNHFDDLQDTKIHKHLDEYQKLVDKIEFREFRQNEFSENLEAELWNNGFFRQIGTTFHNDGGYNHFLSNRKNLDLSKIGIYDNEVIYALCLRADLIFSWLTTEYDELIKKGNKASQTINKFITTNP